MLLIFISRCTYLLDHFLSTSPDASQSAAEATSVPGPDAAGSVLSLCGQL